MGQTINAEHLTLAQLKEELLECWDLPYAVLVLGPAGVGKSSIFKQTVAEIATGDPFASFRYSTNTGCYLVGGVPTDGTPEGDARERETSFGFIDMRLSQVEPQDLAGIPMPENGVTKRHLPMDIPVISASHLPERGLLLLDEVNQADLAVQKAMFSIILDKKIDNKPFKPGWKIMAAGNRLEDSLAVSELAGPLQNRFAHYVVDADYENFKAWALKNGIHPAVTTYLANNTADLCKGEGTNGEYAFPTPRTWEQVSLKVQYWEAKHKTKSRTAKVRGIAALVGSVVANKFVSHLEASDAIKVEDYLSGKTKHVYGQTELPQAYALLSALYSYVLRHKTLEAYTKVMKFSALSDTFKELQEFNALLCHDLRMYSGQDLKAALETFTPQEIDIFYERVGKVIFN